MTQVRLSTDQAYEYASNEVSLVTFLLEIVLFDPKTLKNPKNERKPHFIVRVFKSFVILTELLIPAIEQNSWS